MLNDECSASTLDLIFINVTKFVMRVAHVYANSREVFADFNKKSPNRLGEK